MLPRAPRPRLIADPPARHITQIHSNHQNQPRIKHQPEHGRHHQLKHRRIDQRRHDLRKEPQLPQQQQRRDVNINFATFTKKERKPSKSHSQMTSQPRNVHYICICPTSLSYTNFHFTYYTELNYKLIYRYFPEKSIQKTSKPTHSQATLYRSKNPNTS